MKDLETLLKEFMDKFKDLEFKSTAQAHGCAVRIPIEEVIAREMNQGWRIHTKLNDQAYILARPNPVKDVEFQHEAEFKGAKQQFDGVIVEGQINGKDFEMKCHKLLTDYTFSHLVRDAASTAYRSGYHQGRSDFETDVHSRDMAAAFVEHWHLHGIYDPFKELAKADNPHTDRLDYDKVQSEVLRIATDTWGEDAHMMLQVGDDRLQENTFRIELERRFSMHFEEDWLKIVTVSDAVFFLATFHGCDLPQATA